MDFGMKTKSASICTVSSRLYFACVAVLIIGAATWNQPALAQEKLTLKVVKVDSEETSGEDGKGANAVDGDPETFWHTQWQDGNPGLPHEIVIELSQTCKISGF